MPGCYGLIITGLVWLTLIGAGNPAKGSQQLKQRQSKSELVKPTAIASHVVTATATHDERDPGCQNGQDNRSSELCAQWKAVDATRNSASYSLIAAIISFAGVALVVLTFRETRKVSRAQLRAYISITIDNIILRPDPGIIETDLLITNSGQTPAFSACWAGNIVISTDDEMEARLKLTVKSGPPTDGSPTKCTVYPGKDATASFIAHLTYTEEELQSVIEGVTSLYILGFVWYADAFGTKRESRFCFKSDGLPAPGEEPHPVLGHRCWVMSPFHNEST